jgi:hypothetical protein
VRLGSVDFGAVCFLAWLLASAQQGTQGQNKETEPSRSVLSGSPNYALACFSPSSPDSLANLDVVNALTQLSSGRLVLAVKPTQLSGSLESLMFEAIYAAGEQQKTPEILEQI